MIVAGDFNDWRRRAHAVLAQGASLHEVFVQAYGKAAAHFPGALAAAGAGPHLCAQRLGHAPLVLPRQALVPPVRPRAAGGRRSNYEQPLGQRQPGDRC